MASTPQQQHYQQPQTQPQSQPQTQTPKHLSSILSNSAASSSAAPAASPASAVNATTTASTAAVAAAAATSNSAMAENGNIVTRVRASSQPKQESWHSKKAISLKLLIVDSKMGGEANLKVAQESFLSIMWFVSCL
jgi:hypothetical protein